MSKNKRRFWQQRDCTPWCKRRHRKYDARSDRDCMSEWSGIVKLSLMDPRVLVFDHGVFHERPNIEVWLSQGWREDEPTVRIETETDDGMARFKLTTGEALKLAQQLGLALDIADGHANPGGES